MGKRNKVSRAQTTQQEQGTKATQDRPRGPSKMERVKQRISDRLQQLHHDGKEEYRQELELLLCFYELTKETCGFCGQLRHS